ncbi:hypothetical protein TNIN_492281 [Trichonephila inaurata madagascariensis]|uniref:Uncharacterized protein n=1 Tax=Trichonephila inaurata madagascariensis TaxID=2747483 RepID=A0A8X6IWR5_9ARAC|nr:hypothetical protein TNIN_492281 [Trichonephila inaurata madagascariensis]
MPRTLVGKASLQLLSLSLWIRSKSARETGALSCEFQFTVGCDGRLAIKTTWDLRLHSPTKLKNYLKGLQGLEPGLTQALIIMTFVEP